MSSNDNWIDDRSNSIEIIIILHWIYLESSRFFHQIKQENVLQRFFFRLQLRREQTREKETTHIDQQLHTHKTEQEEHFHSESIQWT